MNMKLLLITLCLINSLVENKPWYCTKDCICREDMGMVKIKCRNNRESTKKLEHLPSGLFKLQLDRYKKLEIPKRLLLSFRLKALRLCCGMFNTFHIPGTVEDLHLSNNQFTYRSLLYFVSQLPKLKRLLFSWNKVVIKETRLSVFKKVPALIHLSLSGNVIPVVSKYLLRHIPLLRHLELRSCDIRYIETGALDDLKHLVELKLDDNKLTTIPDEIFYFQTKLTTLNLSQNQLKLLPKIRGSKFMVFINLDNNFLNDISNITNSTLQSAVSFSAAHNQLTQIPQEFQCKVKIVYSLDLSNNYIKDIGDKSLHTSPLLSVINLGNNKISKITRKTFEGLSFLSSLYLHSNQISNIPEGAFQGSSLTGLFLHNNHLVQLNNSLKGLKDKLMEVTLFGNSIKSLTHSILKDTNPNSKIYIKCQTLFNIVPTVGDSSTVICSEKQAFTLKDVDMPGAKSLSEKGFDCGGDIRGLQGRFMNVYSCKACERGSATMNTFHCIPCLRGGYYQDEAGQSQCKKCNSGQYVNHSGGKNPTECQTCPSGADPYRFAGTRACYCLRGFARRDRFGSCIGCEIKGINCYNDTEHLREGYWWKWHNQHQLDMFECFERNLANHGTSFNESCNSYDYSLPKVYRCPIKSACLGGNRALCNQNYTGPTCAVCSSGYFRTIFKCIKCPTKPVVIVKISIFPWLVLFLTLSYIYIAKRGEKNSTIRAWSDVLASLAKILIAYYQLLAVVIRLLWDLPWPKKVKQISSIIYEYVLHLLLPPSLGCLHQNFKLNAYQKMILSLCIVTFLPVLHLVSFKMHVWIRSKLRGSESSLEKQTLVKGYSKSLLMIYFLIYPSICQHTFQILPFNCVKICYDKEERHCDFLLNVDYTARCSMDDPFTKSYVYIGYVALLIPIFFPVFLLILLWQSKKEMDEFLADKDSALIVVTRFCYENYKETFWYWEVIEILRKLLFSVGFALFGLGTKTNLALLIVLSGMYTMLYAYIQPIKRKLEHYFQLFVLAGLFLNLCMGVLLHVSPDKAMGSKDLKADSIGILFVLATTNLVPLLVLVVLSIYIFFTNGYLSKFVKIFL